MKIRILLATLIALMAIQVANAQNIEPRAEINVVRLVTDANSQLNKIYRQRVSGHEKEQAQLQKAIYAANEELFAIREQLTGGNHVKADKQNSLQQQITSLQNALTAVNDAQTEDDILKTITDVKAKAASLNKAVKKIKKK